VKAAFECGSRLVCRTLACTDFPFLEFRFRVHWNEDRKRLKLAVPSVFRSSNALCEVPGGAILRPCDGEEQVQGRWLVLGGDDRRDADCARHGEQRPVWFRSQRYSKPAATITHRPADRGVMSDYPAF
jgi:hypothetical protein